MFKNNNEKLIQGLPFGFRDIFPVEANERKNIEEAIRQEFISWGYGEVKTPIVEFTENISSGTGKNWKNKLISLFDIDGNLISMRADMTVPIARLAGMRVKKDQLPARFYYFANSFRQSPAQKGYKRVLNQAGLELVGAGSVFSDMEVLIILINILRRLNIEDFKISMGHVQFVEGVCEWFKLDDKTSCILKENLVKNNMVFISEMLGNIDSNKAEMFFDLISPKLRDKKILESGIITGVKKIDESIKHLINITGLLKELELEKYITFDLGIFRDFDYYCGLVFEIYSPKETELIGSGGRYDGLIKKFGLDVPAAGFALDVDLLHKSIKEPAAFLKKQPGRVMLCAKTKDFIKTIKFSGTLKKKGFIVELSFEDKRKIDHMPGMPQTDFIYKPDFDIDSVEITDTGKNIKFLKKISDI